METWFTASPQFSPPVEEDLGKNTQAFLTVSFRFAFPVIHVPLVGGRAGEWHLWHVKPWPGDRPTG